MLPDKSMGFHWFLSHVVAMLGIIGNGLLIIIGFFFNGLLDVKLTPIEILLALVSLILNIGVFAHRNEYSHAEYGFSVAKRWESMISALITLVVSDSANISNTPYFVGELIGSVLIPIILLIYYARRKYIFISGNFVTDISKVKPQQNITYVNNYPNASNGGTQPSPTYYQQKFCPQCGAPLSEQQKFCTNCGVQVR